jgi:hypothetical protein
MDPTKIFESLWNSKPTAQAEARFGRLIIERVLTSGIDLQRADSDMGQMIGTGVSARYVATEGPHIEPGKTVELRMKGGTKWHAFRVSATYAQGDVVRLTLEAEFA